MSARYEEEGDRLTAPQENPAETLDQLKKKQQDSQTKIAQLTKDSEILKEKIASSEKAVTEIGQILSAYVQALKNLDKERKDIEGYFETKTRMIEAAIQNKEQVIDTTIGEFDKEVSAKTDDQRELEKKHNEAKEGYEGAKKAADEKQKAFDFLKRYQKDAEDRLKELKNLRQEIEKEEEKNNIGAMYFLIQELRSTLDRAQIKSRADLEAELYEAWSAVYSAAEDLRVKKEEWEKAKQDLEQLNKELEALKKNRREEILKRITVGMQPRATTG